VHPHKALSYRSPREFRKQSVEHTTEDAVGAVRRPHEGTTATEVIGSRPQPRKARWRAAPALTRAQPWTTDKNTPLERGITVTEELITYVDSSDAEWQDFGQAPGVKFSMRIREQDN
jgi:hypothetical protein